MLREVVGMHGDGRFGTTPSQLRRLDNILKRVVDILVIEPSFRKQVPEMNIPINEEMNNTCYSHAKTHDRIYVCMDYLCKYYCCYLYIVSLG